MTVIDEWTRECLAIDVAAEIRSGRVIEALVRLVSAHGAPLYLRSDNGPEFVSAAILRWPTDNGIDTVNIQPGKLWENGIDPYSRWRGNPTVIAAKKPGRSLV